VPDRRSRAHRAQVHQPVAELAHWYLKKIFFIIFCPINFKKKNYFSENHFKLKFVYMSYEQSIVFLNQSIY
jgi:hypothetical protein